MPRSKSYIIDDYDFTVRPICQRCGKISAFTAKTSAFEGGWGCECTNPVITKAAKIARGY